MKKILILLICCFLLSGCFTKTTQSTTRCTNDSQLDDGRMNYYTWVFVHDNSTILTKDWYRSYEYELLSESLEAEQKQKQECKEKDYLCKILRDERIITRHISYTCGNNSLSDNNCDYIKEIKSLEDNGFICKEDTNE